MTDMVEIRIHGRGGQGNVAAAELLALAAFDDGYQVQAFPAFGAERTGSPVQAFVRLSSKPVRLRSQVYQPDVVIVQDPALARTAEVFAGLKPGGLVLLNAEGEPTHMPPHSNASVFTVPATRIAAEVVGRPIPNAVMLGAFTVATGLVELSSLTAAIMNRFSGELAVKNVRAAVVGRGSVMQVTATAPAEARAADRPTAPAPLTETLRPGSSRAYHTAGWRTSRPIFKYERCHGCDLCAVFCPEGIIAAQTKTHYVADYDYCKGCGICAQECPVDDIVMVEEGAA